MAATLRPPVLGSGVTAAVLAAVLHEPGSARRVLYVNGGEETLEAALERALE